MNVISVIKSVWQYSDTEYRYTTMYTGNSVRWFKGRGQLFKNVELYGFVNVNSFTFLSKTALISIFRELYVFVMK